MLYIQVDVTYLVYNTTDDLLNALDSGLVACTHLLVLFFIMMLVTSGFLIAGKSYDMQQRKDYFLPSCYLLTAFAQWVVANDSGITTEQQLESILNGSSYSVPILVSHINVLDWSSSRYVC